MLKFVDVNHVAISALRIIVTGMQTDSCRQTVYMEGITRRTCDLQLKNGHGRRQTVGDSRLSSNGKQSPALGPE
jgi:hypothetical protein